MIDELQFADRTWLWALVLVPVLAALYLGARWLARRRIRRFGPDVPPRFSLPGSLKATFLLLALAATVLAAARPQWGEEPLPVTRQGSDVMVALDVSRSMAVQDVSPSRFDAARGQVLALLDRLTGDRFGLVISGGTARLRIPLTTDFAAARQIIDGLNPGITLVQPGSSVTSAVDVAAQQLEASEATSKVLIIIGDGEEVGAGTGGAGALPPDTLVFVVGVGTPEGGTVPVLDVQSGTFVPLLGSDGSPVISRLDEARLQSLAGELGGRYVSLDSFDAGAIAAEISRLRPSVFAEGTETRPVDRFQYFLGAAIALLVLALVIPEGRLHWRRRRPTALAVGLLGLLAAACSADAVFELNDRANRLFSEGRHEEALELYRQAQFEDPTLPELNYNAANALHRLGDFEGAQVEARRGTVEGGVVGALSFYTAGNSLFELGRLEQAADAYRDSLRRDPSNADARYNLEVVLALLRQLEEQQQQPPPPQEGEGPPGPEEGEGEGEGAGEQPETPEATGTPEQPGSTAEPGEGDLQEGQQGGQLGPGEIQQALSENSALLEEALAQFEDGVTTEEALAVLELLEERDRLRQQQILGGRGAGPDPNDY